MVVLGLVVLGLVILGMVHSRYGPFWEWSVLGTVMLGMVILGWYKYPGLIICSTVTLYSWAPDWADSLLYINTIHWTRGIVCNINTLY